MTPRTSLLRTTSTLPRRARRTRPQGYQPDCARNLDSNHLQWARTRPWNSRAARCRTSGITTTSTVRAPGIMTTFGTRASENTMLSGTRAPGITTTFGTRAPGIMMTFGTRAPETYMTTEIDSTNDLHTKMTGDIAVTCSGILIIVE